MPNNQIGAETLTSAATTIGPTAATVAGKAHRAIFQVVGSPVRMRADGTAPTSTTGITLQPGDTLEFMGPDKYDAILRNILFILDSSTSTNGTIECAYFD